MQGSAIKLTSLVYLGNSETEVIYNISKYTYKSNFCFQECPEKVKFCKIVDWGLLKKELKKPIFFFSFGF